MRKTPFAAPVLAMMLVARLAHADDQADAEVVLDAAMKAQGGEALLRKFTAVHSKSQGSWHNGDLKVPVSYEGFFDGSDKSRILTYTEHNKLTNIDVTNGTRGWEKSGDQETESLSGDKLNSALDTCYVNWVTMLFPLKEKEYNLSVQDETEIGGRKAVGILVKNEKHDPIKLFFDKENHLLVKCQQEYKNIDDRKVYDQECILSDYRDVQGTKQPFKIEVLSDKAAVLDLGVTEMKLSEKPLDENLFTKP